MHAAPVQRTILSTRRIMVPPLTLCAYMKKGPNLRWSLIQCSGGDEGDRTPDLLTASQALSQLSYAPVRRSTIRELPRRCKDNFGKTFRGRAPESRGAGPACGAPGPRTAPTPADLARGTRPSPRNRISYASPVPLSGPIANRPSSAPQNYAGLLRCICNVRPRTPFRVTVGLSTCGFAN